MLRGSCGCAIVSAARGVFCLPVRSRCIVVTVGRRVLVAGLRAQEFQRVRHRSFTSLDIPHKMGIYQALLPFRSN